MARTPVSRASGGVCTATSDDAPRYRLLADRLNVGPARIVLVDTTSGRVRSWRVTVAQHSTAPGG